MLTNTGVISKVKKVKENNDKKVISIIYITENAKALSSRLCELLCEEYRINTYKYSQYKEISKDIFTGSDFLIYIMATGIVVRSIAPLIVDKLSDPGVIVMDELGKNTISLLSGHVGGANELCERISTLIDSNPVITTATDTNGLGSIDMLSKGLCVDIDAHNRFREMTLSLNSEIVRKKRIKIYAEVYIIDYIKKNIDPRYYRGMEFVSDICDKEISVVITDRISTSKKVGESVYLLVPRINFLGVGCRRNTDYGLFEETVEKYLIERDVLLSSIYKIGTVDLKKDERCIEEFSNLHRIDTRFFTAEELSTVDNLYEKSEFVKKTVGAYSVCEPSCHLLIDYNKKSKIDTMMDAQKKDGITVVVGSVCRNI